MRFSVSMALPVGSHAVHCAPRRGKSTLTRVSMRSGPGKRGPRICGKRGQRTFPKGQKGGGGKYDVLIPSAPFWLLFASPLFPGPFPLDTILKLPCVRGHARISQQQRAFAKDASA